MPLRPQTLRSARTRGPVRGPRPSGPTPLRSGRTACRRLREDGRWTCSKARFASTRGTIRGLVPPAKSGAIDRHNSSTTPASASWALNDGPPSDRTTSAPRRSSSARISAGWGRAEASRTTSATGFQPLDHSGRWGPTGEDHRQVVARALLCEQRQVQVEVQAGTDDGPAGAGRHAPRHAGPAGTAPPAGAGRSARPGTVPAAATIQSAQARTAENTASSAGLPSAPLVPSTAMAPSAEAIMLIISHGRPAGLGLRRAG